MAKIQRRIQMAKFEIVTTAEEQAEVLLAIRIINRTQNGQSVPMTVIAKEAALTANRVRYVITDLVDSGKLRRVPIKAFNKHYVRYAYEIVEEQV